MIVKSSDLKFPLLALLPAIMFLGSAVAAFGIARVAWVEWTLYAMAVTGVVLIGGGRLWPWGIKRVRPAGAGLITGMIVATAEWFLHIL
jgi:hypothetical protein